MTEGEVWFIRVETTDGLKDKCEVGPDKVLSVVNGEVYIFTKNPKQIFDLLDGKVISAEKKGKGYFLA